MRRRAGVTTAGAITSGIPGKCVDIANSGTANGTAVQLYTCNGTAAQKRTVTPGAGGAVRALGGCLDIAGAATANGALVELWSCNGGANQRWVARSDGPLLNPRSGRCLDDPGFSTADWTQLQIWDCNGGEQGVDASGLSPARPRAGGRSAHREAGTRVPAAAGGAYVPAYVRPRGTSLRPPPTPGLPDRARTSHRPLPDQAPIRHRPRPGRSRIRPGPGTGRARGPCAHDHTTRRRGARGRGVPGSPPPPGLPRRENVARTAAPRPRPWLLLPYVKCLASVGVRGGSSLAPGRGWPGSSGRALRCRVWLSGAGCGRTGCPPRSTIRGGWPRWRRPACWTPVPSRSSRTWRPWPVR
ncbi:RICIN domain-containing protein [Streptomyces sp. NPDC003300]|uniref:RICIN domain-containing protein n=1 Tax=unclassified Streptomyces TaxID=2593676 RepID=UPI0033AAF37D